MKQGKTAPLVYFAYNFLVIHQNFMKHGYIS